MATIDQVAADLATVKTTVEEIYQLLYNGTDFVAQPPRPAYFKAVVDQAAALAAKGVSLTGTLAVKPNP